MAKRLLVSSTLLVGSLFACNSVLPATYQAEDLPEVTSLTEEWGCGHGFYVSDTDQTVTLRLTYLGQGPPQPEVDLPDPDWEAVLIEGTDLYSNWWDDVIEADEPTPTEHWALEVVGGHLRIVGEPPDEFTGGSLSLEATDLVVELPSGDVVLLGSIDISNSMWGFVAG
jgi:hypothetical protein